MQASEQTAERRSVPGVTKNWGEVGRGLGEKEFYPHTLPQNFFFALARSFVPFVCFFRNSCFAG